MYYEVKRIGPVPSGQAPEYKLVEQYPYLGTREDKNTLVTSTNQELLELLATILRNQERLEERIEELEQNERVRN